MTPAHTLDADELMHLAIAASGRNDAEQAITLLKRAVELDPRHAKAHYLLGAEHAQIGLFERAAEEMRRAVEIDPQLHTARFQLGLLLLTSGQAHAAEEAWRGLDVLGAQHSLVLFRDGLLCLARDEFDECVRLLRAGMSANRDNAPLNVDMQRIADAVQARIAAAGGGLEADPDGADRGHLLLNAYNGKPS